MYQSCSVYTLIAFLDQDSTMANAKNQDERHKKDHDRAAVLKSGFRMLGAEFFNDTKVFLALKFE